MVISVCIWLVCMAGPRLYFVFTDKAGYSVFEVSDTLYAGELLFIVALAVWGRTTIRRIAAAIFAAALLSVSFVLNFFVMVPTTLQVPETPESGELVLAMIAGVISVLAWVLPWFIARGRSARSWVSMVPIALVFMITALLQTVGLSNAAALVVQTVVIAISVVVFWLFDTAAASSEQSCSARRFAP